MPLPGIYASAISGNLWSPSGAYDSLASVTLSAATASVTFAGIPSGYKHLQVRGIARGTAAYTYANLAIQLNNDTVANYSSHVLGGNGTNAYSAGGGSTSNMGASRIADGNATAGIFGAIIFDILDYSNTNKYKTTKNFGGVDVNGGGNIDLYSGSWQSFNAVSSISIVSGNGNLAQYTTFALYGVK